MPGKRSLRLRTPRREELEAGVIVLLAVLLGGVIAYAALLGEPVGGEADYVLTTAGDFDRVVGRGEPVAVMFTSDTCSVCQRMEPYWRPLCEREGLPVKFVMLKFTRDSVSVFARYGIEETPTFIVFSPEGRILAWHVGAFGGENVTDTMYRWALAAAGLGEGALDLLRSSCSSCHPVPAGLDRESLMEWLSTSRGDALADFIGESVRAGVPPSQMLGASNLKTLIAGMNASLSEEEVETIASLLDAISATLSEGEVGEKISGAQEGGEIGRAAVAGTAFIAGLVASTSPCVFPVLLAYLSMLATGGRADRRLGPATIIQASAAVAAGTLLLGLAFLVLGGVVQEFSRIILPTSALVLLSAGILGVLDVPTFINLGVSTRRGLVGFSFLYGILAVQCSFPLVAGALLLVAGGGLEAGAASLAAFIIGITLPVSLAMWAVATGRMKRLLASLAGKQARRYSHALLAAMGFFLLLYSLGVVDLG